MFTGLIEEVGRVAQVSAAGAGRRVVVAATALAADSTAGDSIAVNGVCLTAEEVANDRLSFHVGAETVQRSTASDWQPGLPVNLERAVATGQRMGGHFVQGHVDCVSQLIKHTSVGETVYFTFSLSAPWRPFVAEKGSIAVDGISLTITEVAEESFAVAIVPYTLQHTNLPQLAVGGSVNLEVDILAKYVYNMMYTTNEAPVSTITEKFLAEHGFS